MHCSSAARFFYRNDSTAVRKWLPFFVYSEEKLFGSKKIKGLCVWHFSNSFHESTKWKSSDVSSRISSFASCNQVNLEESVPYEKHSFSCTSTFCEENLVSIHTNKALLSINTYRNISSCTASSNQIIEEGLSNQFLGRWNCLNNIYQKNYSKRTSLLEITFGSWLTNNLPLQAQQRRSISCSSAHCKTDSDAAASPQVIDWKLASKGKLLGAQHKMETKLGDAAQNHIKDIHDARARMKEKMGEIIERENIFTIPNLLCVFRIVAAPYLCHLVLIGNYPFALVLFLLAGVTDLADGWIARMFPSQASKLGSFLDPLADKVLIAMLFLALTYNGMIPAALTALIIYRDVAIITAASYLRYRSLPVPRTILRYFDATHATVQLAPTGISKLNTVLQLTLITAALSTPVFGVPSPELNMALWGVTTVTTFASGLSYIFSNNTYKVLGKMEEQVEQQQQEKYNEEQQR